MVCSRRCNRHPQVIKPALSLIVSVTAAALLHAAPTQDASPIRAAAAALPRLHSLLVSHRGQVVLEYYAKGHSATRLANIKSASKSIISTLVGIAIERKLIPGVDEPIVRWFPELRNDPDRAQAADHDRGSADDAVRTRVDERRRTMAAG